MSGPQHPFPPNFASAAQNDMRSQFGGPQRGQLPGISSPGQQSVGIPSPQTYNVGVNMQSPADSPIPPPQLQAGPATPQQLQLQLQQRQQQVQQQDQSPGQPSNIAPTQNLQQGVTQPQQSSVPQQPGLQSHQPVSASLGGPSVNAPMHSVSQSVVSSSGMVTSGVVPGAAPQQQPSTSQFNTASLCFLGQDFVQDIVSKVQDIFGNLKTLSPPTGSVATVNMSIEKRTKLKESILHIRAMFKRLRMVYEKCNDNSQLQGMEYMHIESLIPLKEEWDMKTSEERKTSEAYRLASEECKELIDLVIMKNTQLKEIIDHLRRIVWEINTMLTMRKS